MNDEPETRVWMTDDGQTVTTTRSSFRLKYKLALEKSFANAEKWIEQDRYEDGLWRLRVFVRHPRYPMCTVTKEYTFIKREQLTVGDIILPVASGPGLVQRTIKDDGQTPDSELAKIARYAALGLGTARKRLGGPVETADEDQLRIVQGWKKVKGRMRQVDYCTSIPIDPTTLRRWQKKLELEGKL